MFLFPALEDFWGELLTMILASPPTIKVPEKQTLVLCWVQPLRKAGEMSRSPVDRC